MNSNEVTVAPGMDSIMLTAEVTRTCASLVGTVAWLIRNLSGSTCSAVLNLDGDSYRLRDHYAKNDALRATATGTRRPPQ
ncbi:MAG: hypothetical protein WKF47_00230 [Geodermatophilaceae bacterium]